MNEFSYDSKACQAEATILIVDDNPVNVQALSNLFRYDYNVKIADSGKKALEIVEGPSPPTLVLLDIQMPDMDGYEVCRRLKNSDNTHDIPIIFVTAKDEYADEERGLKMGAADYITRPYRPGIIRARVRNQIERRQAEEKMRKSESYIKTVMDNLPIGVAVNTVEPSVKFTYMNENFPKIYRTTREALATPDNFWNAVYEDSRFRDEIRKRILEDCATGDHERMYWEDVPITRTGEKTTFISAGNTPLPDKHLVISTVQDVTVRKEAEDRLKASEARLITALEMANAAYWEYDVPGDMFTFNDRFYSIFHTTAEQVGGYRMSSAEYAHRFVHPADAPLVGKEVRRAIEGTDSGYSPQIDHRIIYADGGTGYVSVRFFIVKDAHGQSVVTHGVSQEITGRKQAEEKMAEQLNELQRWHNVMLDREGRIIELKKEVNELLVNVGKPLRYSSITGEAVKNEPAKNIKVKGSFQDITTAKQSYLALQKANQQLRESQSAMLSILEDLKSENTARQAREAELQKVTMAVEQAGEVIFITDADGIMQYTNPAFTEVTGYTREEAVGQNPRMLKSGEHDELYRDLWRTITSGVTWKGHLINKRKDGALFTEETTVSPVKDETGKILHYVTVKRDITEHLRISEERDQLHEQFQQAQKLESIGRLAGGVAHDFNNMLGVIVGYGEVILDQLRPEDPLRDDIEEIVKAGQRSAALTRQLLAFSRKQTLQPEVLDINHLISNLEKMLHRMIGEDITLELDLADDLNHVLADPGQIEQVIMNLAVNARDAMPDGGRLIIETASMELDDNDTAKHSWVKPGRYVLLALTDNGVGMEKDHLEKIFDPFFTTKETGKGTGLGLATVYGIVKQSGGHILVYSDPDHGTTFKIYLPQTEAVSESKAGKSEKGSQAGAGEKILVVEDEESLRKLMGSLLTRFGYSVTVAANGGEALLLVEEEGLNPDLIISDVVMPNMSGRELIDRLKRNDPNLKVLYMSGYTDNAIVQNGRLDSDISFIQKPFNTADIAKKIKEVLGGS